MIFRNKNKKFLIFWLLQLLSSLFNSLHVLVLPLWVLSLTGSKVDTGITLAIETIVVIIISPFIGTIIDFSNRKFLLFLTDILRFIFMLILLLVNDPRQIYLVYLITFFISIITALFRPLQQAVIFSNVDKRDLSKANSLLSLTQGLSLILGPIFGSMVALKLGYKTTFLMNGISFLIAAFGIVFIKFKKTNITSNSFKKFIENTMYGLSICRKNDSFRSIMFIQLVVYLLIGSNSLLFILFLSNLGFKIDAISFFMVSFGLGIVVGSSIYSSLFKNTNRNIILLSILGLGLFQYLFIFLSLKNNYLGCIPLLFMGFSSVSLGISLRTKLQEKASNDIIGRLASLYQLATQTGSGLSMLVSVFLLRYINANNILLINSTLLVSLFFVTISLSFRGKIK